MNKHRLTALVLSILLLFQTLPAFASSSEEVTLTPTDDSYIVSGTRWKHKNYGNAETMLFGSANDRTALLKFDISSVDISKYEGALLNITFNVPSETGKIEAYIVNNDWTEKKVNYANFSKDYSFAISCDVVNGSKQRISLNMKSVVQHIKKEGLKEISIALKCNAGCVTAYSSEASKVSFRPSLTFTKEATFIKGQYDFKYPTITRQQFKAELEKAVAKGHPYIIATKEHVAKLQEYAFGKDEFLTEHYSLIKSKATELLSTDIIRIDDHLEQNASYITDAINTWGEVTLLALVYLVEGDIRFAQRAYDQAEYLVGLESWGTVAQIDMAQLIFGISICYDWLYDWMTQEQKDYLITNLRRVYMDMVLDVYRNPNAPQYKSSFYRFLFRESGNHTVMDASCIFITAMAFADTDIDWAAELMESCIGPYNSCIADLYPDGLWTEGLTYWKFAGPYVARWLQTMLSAFGHAFGYEDISFMDKLANYPLAATSDQGMFVIGNSIIGTDNNANPIYYLMGQLADDIGLQAYAIELAKSYKIPDAIFALMYDPEKNYDGEIDWKSDYYLRGEGDLVTMKSSLSGTQYTFAGMYVQDEKGEQKGFMDRGTICLDALGERWITNHGREYYYPGYTSASGKKWTWYRPRAEANSVLVIDPSRYRGQEFSVGMGMDTYVSNAGGAFATADLTAAYEPQVESYWRGIQLTDNRKVFVVQDEVVMKKPSELYSFINIYDAEIEILNDGKSAILKKNNKKVYVTVDCDKEYKLETMFAEPLPTSPLPLPTEPNTPNHDFMKLTLHFKNLESANIRWCFMPYICDEELSQLTCEKFVPMSEWTAPTEIKELPVLDDIKVNGVSLDNFNKNNRCYVVETEFADLNVEPVYDTEKYNVSVISDSSTGAMNILLVDKSDNTNINSYSVAVPFIRKPSYIDTSNMSVLKIANIDAPESQEDNGVDKLFDDDLSTRWAASGAGTVMTIELDKPCTVSCVGVGIYIGNRRRQAFDVQLSEDGETWTTAGRFRTSGSTNDKEYFDLGNRKAQYLKIIWNANNESAWNSITELKLYGK